MCKSHTRQCVSASLSLHQLSQIPSLPQHQGRWEQCRHHDHDVAAPAQHRPLRPSTSSIVTSTATTTTAWPGTPRRRTALTRWHAVAVARGWATAPCLAAPRDHARGQPGRRRAEDGQQRLGLAVPFGETGPSLPSGRRDTAWRRGEAAAPLR
jgi:hypothetical protein